MKIFVVKKKIKGKKMILIELILLEINMILKIQ